MTETHTNAPIFIVGSPRSGTSILTWCLGQHPNILPCEESDWIGPFALQVAAHHAIGSARGERSQLAALGVAEDDFSACIGDAINQIVVSHRAHLEANSGQSALEDPAQVSSGFAISRGRDEPKARWVDGTPEYAYHIYGLHRLFPGARFVHIARDVDEVVASMLNFRKDDGMPLASNEEHAYARWLRAAQACELAEQALGAQLVHRVRFVDLVEQPQGTLTSILNFLGEAFADPCLEPLRTRINSTAAEDGAAHVAANPGLAAVKQAQQLSRRLQQPRGDAHGSAQALQSLRDDFAARVEHVRELGRKYRHSQKLLAAALESDDGTVASRMRGLSASSDAIPALRFRGMIDKCGAILALQGLGATCALALSVLLPDVSSTSVCLIWFALALAGVAGYAWMRRAGVRASIKRIFGGH